MKPFVYTGFKPAFVMYKNADDEEWWGIMDNGRSTPQNPVNNALFPNEPISRKMTILEVSDFLSNGLNFENSNALNGTDDNIIYMAFAEKLKPASPDGINADTQSQ